MAGTMQRFWKHEVPKTQEGVGERINLTFWKHEVPKTQEITGRGASAS
jgi:hypothetical protein